MGHFQVYQAQFTVRRGTISDVRGAFYQITGFTRKDFLNKRFDPVFRKLLKATVEIKQISPGADPVTCFIFTRDFEAREVNVSASIGSDPACINYRIEETPGIRFDRRFSGLKKLFADSKLGVCMLSSPELILLRANDAFLNLLGCEAVQEHHEVLGRRLDELIDRELLPGIKSELTKVIGKDESQRSFQLISKSRNQYCSIDLFPISDSRKNRYILGVIRDISEFVLEMEKSRERKTQLEFILENMNDGLIITDNQANVIMMNAAARSYFKNPKCIRNLADCFDKLEASDMDGNPVTIDAMPVHRAIRGEKVKNFRVVIKERSDKRVFEYNTSPLYDQNGDVFMTISCCRDITDQVEREKMVKAHQEALFRAEQEKNEALRKAMALKDEFLSLISHEFKTPISVIIAAVQAMEALFGGQLDTRIKNYIQRIRQNAYRQLRLVNNLLELARISSGQVKMRVRNYDIVFLSSSITRSVVPYADQKGVKLFFSSTIREKIIGIDDEKYERILLNLLSNAIKFTPGGKSVFVRLSCIDSKQGGQVCVEVEDEGIGIPEDQQEMIFEKLAQVEGVQAPGTGGTGLGLSLAKLYTKALGGSLSLKSQVGRGSCFTLLLPDRQADVLDSVAECAACGPEHPIQRVAIEFSDLYPME
ncbi:MAG TPA: PAS domain-containing sensor histidine kinase [Thermoclostridium caenicola]|nr:PAS domain-containing sensor histidine kinase [Thermoclostridium caenicola]HOK42569.1 PAS domain-containing sensor histidine kinase [Thermoclostridium caenicola]HOL83923.1 PAS domain-containing sensor histidine kinase [Thermoclostridium caenicola]HPO76321.1 PAS domain-containing sensor histidine kinase [Thermoclostridium caenicola]HPU22222.1 PAS domain-containing sensor histidine kinase [Thermoclostridium caenicola]